MHIIDNLAIYRDRHMPLFYRPYYFVIALPASGIYKEWDTSGGFGFQFDNSSALAFSATALLTMVLTHLQSNPLAGLTCQNGPEKPLQVARWVALNGLVVAIGFITGIMAKKSLFTFARYKKTNGLALDSTSNTPWSMARP